MSVVRVAYLFSLAASAVAAAILVLGGVNAIRDAAGPNRLVVPLRVERLTNAQLFYDRGEGIRAEDCATAMVRGGTALREVAFRVPRVALRELRLDPMPHAGEFAVGAPWLESASGRTIAKFPLSAVKPREQIQVWEREGERWVGRTVAGANDPQVTLELGAPLRVGRPRVPWIEAMIFGLLWGGAVWLKRRPENREWSGWGFWKTKIETWERWGEARPLAVLIGFVGVAGVEAWRLWPLHRTLDWPVWDELNYAAAGAAWQQHGGILGEIHSAPLYIWTYAWLSQLGGYVETVFAQHYLLKLGTVLLLYLLLVRWWRTWVGAAAVALAWGAAQFHLEMPVLVYQAAWLWFLAALVTVDRWPLAGLGLAVAAACVRQEYQFAAVVLAGWLGWRMWRERGRGIRKVLCGEGWAGVALGVVVSAGVGFVMARTEFSGSTGRAWFAFQQHYALREVAAGNASGLNAWVDYRQITEADFGEAASLREALQANPGAVARHVGHNLLRAGPEAASLWKAHPELGTSVLLAIAGLVCAVARRGRPAVEKRELTGSVVLAASGVLAIGPGLVVLAKDAYLLPAVPAMVGAVAWLLGRGGRRWVGKGVWVGAAGMTAVVVVMGIEVASGRRVFVPEERERPVAETVAVLAERWPSGRREVLLSVGAEAYARYLGVERCAGVEALPEVAGVAGPNESLAEKVARHAPRAVLVTREWRESSRFDEREFAEVLAAPEWTALELPAGRVYWRK
jgi:hypothetical protein